jgi:hypothetical protein
MIKDLFSHKIHSSGDEWPEKLVELAAIFGEFDGQLYDRTAFEERLRLISPRSSYVAADAAASTPSGSPRDVSKFRDEVSAYPAYLGLYFLERSANGWIVRVGETTKRFLLSEEPDVGSFLRLQLPLFQHPNGKGARYHASGATLQSNAARETLDLVRQGIHLAPLRLVCAALKADAVLRNVDILQAQVMPREVFGLFIFEIKSGGDSLLEQIRKGLSQLYEYRYRYKAIINDDHISLCLVLPESPDTIPWITEYLCDDREINICWFNDDELEWPNLCAAQMQALRAKISHA